MEKKNEEEIVKNSRGKKIFILLALVSIVFVGTLLVSKISTGNQEDKLASKLEVVGRDFYENMYHSHIVSSQTEAEATEFLQKFSDIGIKVDLDNLSRYDEEKYPNLLEEFVNKKSDVACDVKSTRVVIYPKEPFAETDYLIETELNCGFESKE